MASSNKRNVALVSALLAAMVAVVWAGGKYREFTPNPSVDNGVNSTIPGPPPEAARVMRRIVETRQANGQSMPVPPESPEKIDPATAMEIASMLTDEEKQIMRQNAQRMMEQRKKVHEALGPQEAPAFEAKMRVRITQAMSQNR